MWNTSKIIVALWAVWGLSACAFDDDARFVPRPRAAYFLNTDSNDTTLVRCDETGGLSAEPAADFDLHVTEKNTTLWVIKDHKIVWRGLDSGKAGERNFDAFVLKGVCAGNSRHVVWGKNKLCFFSPDKPQNAVVIEANFTPRTALYNHQKFYFVADSFVAVWHETAYAEILRISTKFRPEHADFDALYNFMVIGPGEDGRYYSSKISATANVGLYSDAPSEMRTLWHSRIWKTQYGDEGVLQTAGMRADGVAVPNVGLPADDLFFDFRHTRGYYLSGDSLWAYDFSPQLDHYRRLFGLAWKGRILKARFDASSGK